MKTLDSKKAQGIMLICVLLWSLGGALFKMLPWHPFMIAGGRSFFASIILFGYIKFSGLKIKVDKFTVAIGISMAINFFAFISANKLTTAANAVMLQSANPIFIIIISAILFKQMPTKREITVVSVCFFGIVLFFLDNLSPGTIFGNILSLFTGLMMAIMFIASSKATSADANMTGIFLGHAITALVGIPIGLTAPVLINNTTIFAVLALGILQLGIPYVLYGLAIRSCPPLSCSLIAMLEPLLNPVWVFFLVGESPGKTALMGGAVVMLTVLYWCIYSAKNAANATQN